jgi:phage shock protein PspC (stress-responsive transcriptional regulator)
MKKYGIILITLIAALPGVACPICDENQPKPLRGITHGTGPESQWDYVIIGFMIAVVLLTLFYSVKWLIYPAETAENHIKRRILALSTDAR